VRFVLVGGGGHASDILSALKAIDALAVDAAPPLAGIVADALGRVGASRG
jgi:hypothetical protein